MKIAMLTMEKYDNRRPGSTGSSRIRGEWVMKYCKDIVPFQNARHYDAVIYQKAYFEDHMKLFKGIKIFDLCDPDWFEVRPVTEVLHHVDAVTVPTQALANYLKQIRPEIPIVVIPDRIDPEAHETRKTFHVGPLRSVVWFGYSANAEALEQVLVPLKEKGINLVVISEKNFLDADVNIKYDQETVFEEIIKHDAVILPEYDKNERFQFKSNNKMLTSWALGMPVIRTYDDMETFNSPEARKAEGNKRYTEVREKYHVKHSGPEYVELIEKIAKSKGR